MTRSEAPPYPDDVFQVMSPLLDRYAMLCARLESASHRQSTLAASDEPGPIVDVLAERQRVLDQIMSIEPELRGHLEDWLRVSIAANADQVRIVRATLDSTAAALSRVAARDAHDAVIVGRRRDELAARLGGLTRSRDGAAAYSRPAAPGPLFQDRAG